MGSILGSIEKTPISVEIDFSLSICSDYRPLLTLHFHNFAEPEHSKYELDL